MAIHRGLSTGSDPASPDQGRELIGKGNIV